MAKDNISAAPAAEVAEEETAPVMYKVQLSKVVSVYGLLFKPGREIVADEATVKAFGDAVISAEQV